MNKLKTLLIVTLAIGLVTAFAGLAMADTWYVDSKDGSDTDNTGKATDSAYKTLHQAIDGAGSTSGSDTIYMDPEGDPYQAESGSGSVQINVAHVTIIAKDFDGDVVGADTVKLTTEDVSTGLTEVVKVSVDNVTMHSFKPSSYKFELTATMTTDPTTISNARDYNPDYGLKIDTSSDFTAAVSSISLSDFVVVGSDSGGDISTNATDVIWKAGLYVKTGSTYAVDGLTIDNWNVDKFNETNSTAGIHLYEDGPAIDADVKNSSITTTDADHDVPGILLNGTSTPSDFDETKISKNEITFTDNTGIELSGEMENATVESNYLHAASGTATGVGIELGDADDNTIQGNQVEGGLDAVQIDSTTASGNSFTQNYIHADTTTGTADSVHIDDDVGANNSFTYNNIGNGGASGHAFNAEGISGNNVDASNNYWGTDVRGYVTGSSTSTGYIQGAPIASSGGAVKVSDILRAVDLSEARVDADWTEKGENGTENVKGQAELTVSDSLSATSPIYGYNRFGYIYGGTPAVLALTYDAIYRTSTWTVYVQEIDSTNSDTAYDDNNGDKFVFGTEDQYTKLLSVAGTDTTLERWVDVDAKNVQIGASGKGFTIQDSNSDSTLIVAVSARNLTVIGNKIVQLSGGTGNDIGIDVDNTGVTSTGDTVTITDNTVKDLAGGDAVYVKGNSSSGTYYTSVSVTGNEVHDNSGGDGISLNTVNTATVTNNQVFNNGTVGLVLDDVAEGTVKTSAFTGNTSYGVQLSTDTKSVVIGGSSSDNKNKIKNNEDSGIYISSSGADNKAQRNVITGNTNYNVENDTTTSFTATYNYWGDSSGPYHPDNNPDGEALRVSDYVTFDPYWTKVSGFETTRGLKPPTVRPDEPGSLSSISAVGLDVYIYTLHLGWEMV